MVSKAEVAHRVVSLSQTKIASATAALTGKDTIDKSATSKKEKILFITKSFQKLEPDVLPAPVNLYQLVIVVILLPPSSTPSPHSPRKSSSTPSTSLF